MAELLSDAEIAAGPIRVDEIQGNVLAGFNKDHQALLFVRFGDAAGARAWLAGLAARVATTAEVVAFRRLFRTVNARAGGPDDDTATVRATWINAAITRAGLDHLGESADGMDDAFRNGMSGRQATLGDDREAAPANWVVGGRRGDVHAVLVVAADLVADLRRAVVGELARAAGRGLHVVFVQEGHVRPDAPGHEHFGFKDGISQPAIAGFHDSADPLPVSEFVLGYDATPADPAWTRDGSYFVVRRLRQDVPAFQEGVEAAAKELGVTPDLARALIMGRHRSGAPLALTGRVDADPGVAGLAQPINAFDYGDDPDGGVVPRAAHIRKVNARASTTPRGGPRDTRRRRLLRRGIPYGASYRAGADAAGPHGREARFPLDRGLLFQCYCASIVEQFELVMSRWVTNPGFPREGDGVDAVLSEGEFAVDDRSVSLRRFVVATGGEYGFAPSISGLRHLARAA